MSIRYRTVNRVEDPLIFLKTKHDVVNGGIVKIKTPDGSIRSGKVLKIEKDIACIQTFQGTKGLDKDVTEVEFFDQLFSVGFSSEMKGKIFNGLGTLKKTVDQADIPEIIPEVVREVSGNAINPYDRLYPDDIIKTGISVIDGLNTVIRGQKLPIFSGQGMPHNQLAAQIVKQGKVEDEESFVIIFVGIGLLEDDAIYFQDKFKESGNIHNVVTFLNLANDPTIERLLVPKVALTAAEYFAFDLDMHVLVVMTDMTNYCEALRELSASKGEIPGRKGFPGYLYSDLAAIYERAGRIDGKKGSITQIPIVSMPNDDITHPIPDLTGYITEGQIVFSRELSQKGIYPPVDILSSVSRLMKDAIGEGRTREDHQDIMNQIFDLYNKSLEIRELKSIIGEESLTTVDKKTLEFGENLESYFINQKYDENRSFEKTFNIAWALLSNIPQRKLVRIDRKYLKKYYVSDSRIKNYTGRGVF